MTRILRIRLSLMSMQSPVPYAHDLLLVKSTTIEEACIAEPTWVRPALAEISVGRRTPCYFPKGSNRCRSTWTGAATTVGWVHEEGSDSEDDRSMASALWSGEYGEA